MEARWREQRLVRNPETPMTTFIDGPAKGQHLLLKSSPPELTVVVDATGKWDALDQPGDSARPGERTFQYLRDGEPVFIHINRGRGQGGLYSMARYRWAGDQPPTAPASATEAKHE